MQLPAPSLVCKPVRLRLLPVLVVVDTFSMAQACCMSCLKLILVQPHGTRASGMLIPIYLVVYIDGCTSLPQAAQYPAPRRTPCSWDCLPYFDS